MSLPHERRKATLKSAELKLRVRAAETKEQLKAVRSELSAMRPKKSASSDPLKAITGGRR
jgi:hypothetical protein